MRSLSFTFSAVLAFSIVSANSSTASSTQHIVDSRVADCPLAGLRLSINTPLFDILTNETAIRTVHRMIPGTLDSLPPQFSQTTLPSLSAILPFRIALGQVDSVTTAQLDAALRSIAVTASDDRKRCARYDSSPPPTLPAIVKTPAILVFDKSNGYRDVPSVDAAASALRTMAKESGWQLVFSDRPAVFNRRDLDRFDVVIWNNVSGDVLSLSQRAAFKAYIEGGGGYVGIHGSGGDPITFWSWYVDKLVGARFKGHPSEPQFQQARLIVEDPQHEIVKGLGSGWVMSDEWYSFHASPRVTGAHVLLTIDEASYNPVGYGENLRMGDHPIAWTRCVRKGRSFYTAIGHMPETYAHPLVARLLKQGITWAAGMGTQKCEVKQRTGLLGLP